MHSKGTVHLTSDEFFGVGENWKGKINNFGLITKEFISFSWLIFASFVLLISFLFEMSFSMSESAFSNLAIALTLSNAVKLSNIFVNKQSF